MGARPVGWRGRELQTRSSMVFLLPLLASTLPFALSLSLWTDPSRLPLKRRRKRERECFRQRTDEHEPLLLLHTTHSPYGGAAAGGRFLKLPLSLFLRAALCKACAQGREGERAFQQERPSEQEDEVSWQAPFPEGGRAKGEETPPAPPTALPFVSRKKSKGHFALHLGLKVEKKQRKPRYQFGNDKHSLIPKCSFSEENA